MNIRTRFAPSPTGYLHIGGVRTALYCWLFARKNQGKFILRIEDTDRERSTSEAIEAILKGMAWLNLDYDEGPFYQTERFPRYHEVMNQFLAEGKAYRCFCSKERLENLRNQQIENKSKPRYDGKCRELNLLPGETPHVIRFKNPAEGEVVVDDQAHGKVVFQNAELDDLIIARSDGTPTYNFTVVVDDFDMKITHVIRGDDHLNNTPRQINMLKALGANIPIYAHLPMILGPDGKKLSKRHGAVSVLQYREEGFLYEALLNYLVRLGWSHGDQEIFSLEEMIQLFDIKDLNASAAAFNPEKLLWLNQHYLKTEAPEKISEELAWHLKRVGVAFENGPPLTEVVMALRERSKTLKEMAEKSRLFYEIQKEDVVLPQISPEILAALQYLRTQLQELEEWSALKIHEIIEKTAEKNGVKLGKLAQPLRQIVTGSDISPPIDVTLKLLGKKRVMQRLEIL